MAFPSTPSRLKSIQSVNDISSQFRRTGPTSSSSSSAVNDPANSVYIYGTMSSKLRSFFRLSQKKSLSNISWKPDANSVSAQSPPTLSEETLKAMPEFRPLDAPTKGQGGSSPSYSSVPTTATLSPAPFKGPRRCRSDNLLFKKPGEPNLQSSVPQLPSPTTRTYSSNSIKVKTLNVKPSSFITLKLLGKGDVGRVYLVKHKNTEKLYAMKVLSKKEMIKRNKVKRALAEQEILASANHPFIVTLYHSFQSENHLYLCMEHCLGGEFFRVLQGRPGKCLSEDEAKFYAAEVTCALEYLHLMGFIYRDLKPENFDLSKQSYPIGEPSVIKNGFSFSLRSNDNPPALDTKSCTGHFRTNSFVGTEGSDRSATFSKILKTDINFPNTPHGYSGIIRKLLNRDEYRRLGSKAGASDVKTHPFFKSINFALLRNMIPPIIPPQSIPEIDRLSGLQSSQMKSNSRRQGDGNSLDIEREKLVLDSNGANPFSNFSSVTLSHEGDDSEPEEDLSEALDFLAKI